MSLITQPTLTEEFVDMLAMELLPRPDDEYVFFTQGPYQNESQAAAMPGEVILFNRPVLPTGDYDEASRRLTEGTPIDTDSQGITMDQESLTVREYGGPHDGSKVIPFGITEWMRKRAKHDLAGLIGTFLRRDRTKFLDTVTLNMLLSATLVVTPNGAAEGVITSGQAATAAWLRAWGKAMFDAKIPSFGGRYRLWINSRQNKELLADEEFREATRYLVMANPAFKGQVTMFDRFDIGVATTLPTKAVGAGGAVTGYQAVAYGPLGLGYGEGMAASPRSADDTDFGRQERVMWIAHECFGVLMSDFLSRGVTT